MNTTDNKTYYLDLKELVPDYSHDWLAEVKNNIPDSISSKIRHVFTTIFYERCVPFKEAATLLHYHPNNQRYQPLIKQIEQQHGVTPLIEQHRSRHEHDFGNKLQSALESHPAFRGFRLNTQHHMPLPERHYFVDFKLDLPTESIYIEFDEEAHQQKRSYIEKDRLQNEHFAKAALRLVRVRHKEADIWLDVVAKTGQIKRYEEFMRDLLNAANINTSRKDRGRLAITAKSLKEAVDNHPQLSDLLPTSQPLRYIKGILKNRLNITLTEKKDKVTFSKSTLDNRCQYR